MALGLAAIISTAVVIAFAAFSVPKLGASANLIDDLGLVFALSACLYALRRTSGDVQLMWRLLTAAVFCWLAGEAVFDLRVVALGSNPGNTLSNVLYLAFYPFAIAGLIVRDRGAREKSFDIRMTDAIVAALAIAVVAYGLIFQHPVAPVAQSIGVFEKVGYPLVNGLLIWTVAYQLYSRKIVWDTTRSLLACAVFAIFGASVFWSMVGGPASGASMSTAMTLIGFAALVSPRRSRMRTATGHQRRTVAPEVLLLLAYVGVVAVVGRRLYAVDPTLTILAGTAMMVVVMRLIIALTQNEKLLGLSERRGETDALTGLSNLQHFRERLDGEIARSEREGGSFALVTVDIDNFKSINDIAGHRAGDEVLIAVAETMRRTFRPFDVVCRIGGDEMAIIAPHAGPAEALQIAWRLCHNAREITLSEFPDLPPVSVSVGCAVFPTLATNATELIDHADEALYRVKQNERGGAELYSADAPQPADGDWELDRVRAQLAARDADFQAVFRHAREAMVIIDEMGTILMVNEMTTRLFGANRERIIGHRASTFLHTDQVAEFERLLPEMAATGELTGKFELQVPSADAPQTIEFSAARFAPDRFLTILWDVTKSDREAAELTKSEQRFRALFESSLDPIFVTDDAGLIREANRAAAKMTGRPLDEMIGKRVDELVQQEEMSEVLEQVDELGELRTARGTFTTRDEAGVLRTVEYRAVADSVPGLHLTNTNVREISSDVREPADVSA